MRMRSRMSVSVVMLASVDPFATMAKALSAPRCACRSVWEASCVTQPNRPRIGMHPWHDIYVDDHIIGAVFPAIIEVPMGSKNKY